MLESYAKALAAFEDANSDVVRLSVDMQATLRAAIATLAPMVMPDVQSLDARVRQGYIAECINALGGCLQTLLQADLGAGLAVREAQMAQQEAAKVQLIAGPDRGRRRPVPARRATKD